MFQILRLLSVFSLLALAVTPVTAGSSVRASSPARIPAQNAPSSPAGPPPSPDTWQQQLVAWFGKAGPHNALALDSDDRPHIAFDDSDEYRLHYAVWNGLAWDFDIIDADRGGNIHQSRTASLADSSLLDMAMDAGNTTHVVYTYKTPSGSIGLRYAIGGQGGWDVSSIPVASGTPLAATAFAEVHSLSLALDADRRPHYCYTRYEPVVWDTYPITTAVSRAYYGHLDDTGWQLQLVAERTTTYFGLTCSLALDSAGEPHMAIGGRFEDDGLGRLLLSSDEPEALSVGSPTLFGAWAFTEVAPDSKNPSLVLDSLDRPHVAYTLRPTSEDGADLRYARWDGLAWQDELVAAEAAERPDLALDALDQPVVAGFSAVWTWEAGNWNAVYPDGTYPTGRAFREIRWPSLALDSAGSPHVSSGRPDMGNVYYGTLAPAWQTDPIAGFATTPSLAVDKWGRPHVSYSEFNQLRLADWAGVWDIRDVASAGVYGALRLNYAGQQALPRLAFYDPLDGHLHFTAWNGSAWLSETVDSGFFTGNYASMALDAAGRPHIGYWDAINSLVKYASWDGSAWTVRTNTASPPLSGPQQYRALSIGLTRPESDGCCKTFVAYYDTQYGDLRLATWDGSAWSDERVDGEAKDAGRWVSLAVDAASGRPVMAYADVTNQAVKVANLYTSTWAIQTVETGLGTISDVSLAMTGFDREYARVAYSVGVDNSLRLATYEDSLYTTWVTETVAYTPGSAPREVALTTYDRDRLVFTHQDSGLVFAYRSATTYPLIDYNALRPCLDEEPPAGQPAGAAAGTGWWTPPGVPPQVGYGDSDDLGALRALRDLFATTPGGQHYIDLYYAHSAETGALGLADPELMWDAFNTLQNFLPGFAALASGQGGRHIITQGMVNQANDIADRLSAAGSPALAAMLAQERAAFGGLEDFVDLSFDEAALLIGVNPPHVLYLPQVSR